MKTTIVIWHTLAIMGCCLAVFAIFAEPTLIISACSLAFAAICEAAAFEETIK